MNITAPPASYETRFTRLVGCRLPIQSAPMAGVVSDAGLPAAVAAAGGHGMLPALFLSAPYLARVTNDLNGRTRAYGVNFIGLMLGGPEVPVHPRCLPELGSGAIARSVAQRLARRGPGPDKLARAVAVLGTDVEPRHAYRLAGLPEPAGTAAEQALIGADVLASRRPLEFVHPIVRAAVAQLLSPPERATRHLEAARMLGAEGMDAERLAPQLLAGDARADPWVVDILRRAAGRSLHRGAPEAAVRYLQRALDEPPARELRPAILAELGKAEIRAALPDDAVIHLREALAGTDDPRTRALMTHDLAIGLIAPGRYAEAVAMLEQAAESARGADPELSRRLKAELLCAAKLDARTLPIGRSLDERLPAHIEAGTPGGRMLLATSAHERMMRGGTAKDVAEMAARDRRRADQRAIRRLGRRYGCWLCPRRGGRLPPRRPGMVGSAGRRPAARVGDRLCPLLLHARDPAPVPGRAR